MLDFSHLSEDFYSSRGFNHGRSLVVVGAGDVRLGGDTNVQLLDLELIPERFGMPKTEIGTLNVVPTNLKFFFPGLEMGLINLSDTSNYCFIHESGRGGYYEMEVRGIVYHVPCVHVDTILPINIFGVGGKDNMMNFPSSIYLIRKISSHARLIEFSSSSRVGRFSFPFSPIGDVTNVGYGNQFRLGMCFEDGVVEFGYDNLKCKLPLIEGESIILALNNHGIWTIFDVLSLRRNFLLSYLYFLHSFECSGLKIVYGVTFQFVVHQPVDLFLNVTKTAYAVAPFDNGESSSFIEASHLKINHSNVVVSAVFPRQHLPSEFLIGCDFSRPRAILMVPSLSKNFNLRKSLESWVLLEPKRVMAYMRTFGPMADAMFKSLCLKLGSRITDRELFDLMMSIRLDEIDYVGKNLVHMLLLALDKSDVYPSRIFSVHVNLMSISKYDFRHFEGIVRADVVHNFGLSQNDGVRLMYPYYVPVTNGSVSIVTVIEGLCQVKYPFLLLYEIYRILKPGGVLLFSERNVETEFDLAMVGLDRKYRMNGMWESYANKNEWMSLVAMIGFEQIVVTHYDIISRIFFVRCVRGPDNKFAASVGPEIHFVNEVPPPIVRVREADVLEKIVAEKNLEIVLAMQNFVSGKQRVGPVGEGSKKVKSGRIYQIGEDIEKYHDETMRFKK